MHYLDMHHTAEHGIDIPHSDVSMVLIEEMAGARKFVGENCWHHSHLLFIRFKHKSVYLLGLGDARLRDCGTSQDLVPSRWVGL